MGSTLPAGSTAWISIDRVPSGRPANVSGEMHAVAGAPFSEHRNVAVGSVEVNANVAVGELVRAAGWDVI